MKRLLSDTVSSVIGGLNAASSSWQELTKAPLQAMEPAAVCKTGRWCAIPQFSDLFFLLQSSSFGTGAARQPVSIGRAGMSW